MRLHAILAALILFLLSPAVWALSLGEAEAQSHLNQPLKATITVRAVNNDERDTIRAIIPDAEKFKRAGVRRDAIIDRIQVDVSDGKAEDELLIHLRTDERIQEPFLNFLVEVRWLGGSVIREYTLLLDPASVAESRQESGSQDVATQSLQQSGAGSAEDEPPVYQPEQGARRSASSGSRSYGPVQRHETLWSIAYDQRTDPGITMDQMQLAIYQANPQAFDGNINRLQTGSMLQIPPNHEIRAIDPDYAKREVSRQKSSYRPPAPESSPPPVVAEPEPMPEPEPVEEVAEPEESIQEPTPEPEEDMVATAEPEPTPAEQESEAPAAETAGEIPPDQAAAPPTADSQPLTQDELMAEGEEDFGQADEKDIEMPSVWAEEEGGEKADEAAPATGDSPAEPTTGQVDPEPVVNQPPKATGINLPPGLNPVTLILALVLILVLLGTYWWYRRRRTVNVGAQFAYVSEEDVEDEEKSGEDEPGESTESGGKKASTRVWQDTDAVPDSIDEYTARSDAGKGGAGFQDSAVQTVEVEPEETSPIRDMTSEEIDYLGEADVHLAYGLYDEAASVLQRGINENPNRDDLRLKLLEVHHSADQADEFVRAAEDWQKSGVEDEKAWQKAVKLGSKIAPGAALFAQAGSKAEGKTAQPDEKAAPPPPEESATGKKAAATEETSGRGAEELDFDLSSFDMTEPEQAGDETAQEPAGTPEQEASEEDTSEQEKSGESEQTVEAVEESGMDTVEAAGEEAEALDFEGFDMPAAEEDEAADKDTTEKAVESDKPASDEEGLDFDMDDLSLDEKEESPSDEEDGKAPSGENVDEEESDVELDEALASLGGEEPEAEVEEAAEPADLELGDLDLEAPEADKDAATEGAEPAPAASPDEKIADKPAMDQEGDEEVSVKLDLARAYLDMGEPEMARTLLDEVVDMGNEQQRQEAQDLLTRVG